MTATLRAIRPAYTSSPVSDFSLASVKPVAISPGSTAQTVIPKGRTSLARARQ